jgi:hypothetical protein
MKPLPDEFRKPRGAATSIPNPLATHQGGFYAVVIQDLLEILENLSEVWTASVQVVVHPKLMTKDEHEEMDAYHAARRQMVDALGISKALEKVEQQRAVEEEAELRRMKQRHDYPRQELVEWETRNLLRHDSEDQTPIGTYW